MPKLFLDPDFPLEMAIEIYYTNRVDDESDETLITNANFPRLLEMRKIIGLRVSDRLPDSHLPDKVDGCGA